MTTTSDLLNIVIDIGKWNNDNPSSNPQTQLTTEEIIALAQYLHMRGYRKPNPSDKVTKPQPECYDPEPEAKGNGEQRKDSSSLEPDLRPSSPPENPRGTTQFDFEKLADQAKHVVEQGDSILKGLKALQRLLDSKGVGRQDNSK